MVWWNGPGGCSEQRRKIERLCGIVAIAGGLINAAGDLLLRCGPVAASQITHDFMATMPYAQVQRGALLGAALGIPMWFAILVPLDGLLGKVRGPQALLAKIFLAYLFLITAIYHGVYAFYASSHKLAASFGSEHPAVQALLAENQSFESSLGMCWFAGALLSSLALAACVFTRGSELPKWLLGVLPLSSIAASYASGMLPAPVGGFIRPMAGTLLFTAFFVAVTWLRRKAPKAFSG